MTRETEMLARLMLELAKETRRLIEGIKGYAVPPSPVEAQLTEIIARCERVEEMAKMIRGKS